ncbi:MAG: putative zinc-binding protein [Fibrobacterota bacterium]
MSTNCECTTTPKLVFSCCGAADVGDLADRVARQLNREGTAKMYCLTGIGAGIQNIIDYSKTASSILAIDGCPVDCTKKLLEKAGINDFAFLRITDLGYTKGKTDITDEIVSAVTCQASNLIKENVHAK